MKELERETKEAGSEAFGEHSQMRLYMCVKMALWTSKYIDVNKKEIRKRWEIP